MTTAQRTVALLLLLMTLVLPVAAQDAIPTALPNELVQQADVEYTLLTNLYERTHLSVVNIDATAKLPDDSVHQGLSNTSSGSGFVYDLNGIIITNAHVVKDAESLLVTFNDGYVADARLIGFDVFSDVGVIQVSVNAERLHPVTFGDSDALKVGQRVVAIGNPFGLASSMTTGIISALGRQLPSAELLTNTATPGFNNPDIIQVDADINPGNSGGPLFNSYGEVVGMNTAIRTTSGVFEGVGFAVPARTVLRVAPEIIQTGAMHYAWVGIQSLASEAGLGVVALAEPLGLPVSAGVLIDTVIANSPADKAGLRGGSSAQEVRGQTVCVGGDIIIAVNDVYVQDMDDLTSYLILNTRPGDTVQLLIIRDGETQTTTLTLEPRPTDAASFVTSRGC